MFKRRGKESKKNRKKTADDDDSMDIERLSQRLLAPTGCPCHFMKHPGSVGKALN